MPRKIRFALIIILVAGLPVLAQDGPPKGAKEMFFDPQQASTDVSRPRADAPPRAPRFDTAGRRIPHSTDSAKQTALGLSYWIELADASGTPMGPVTDEHTFRSGDRIRLHFRSNSDGHVLLVQLGSSGTSSVLFPDPARGLAQNRLHAQEDHVLPSPARWFKFDRNAGTETLLVLFARTQPELDKSFPTHTTMDAEETGALLELVNDAPGRKDLIIEDETREPTEVGTYAVSVAGKPIILQVVLKHH
ncbi:MAG TPA: DUF4384 domain-containing protein [Thermoanaerobaculia bacterium]|jgi:hypothetical protein|nr:DUF4384 domain-containing protein [Thermoanaerobaculia bacterium]